MTRAGTACAALAALLALAGGAGCASAKVSIKAKLTIERVTTRARPGEYVVLFGNGIAGIPLEGETAADAARRRQAFADRAAAEAVLGGSESADGERPRQPFEGNPLTGAPPERSQNQIRYRYSDAVIGFAGTLSPAALLAVRGVTGGRAWIEPNLESVQATAGGPAALGRAMASTASAAPPLPYGLDRIGQRLLDLNGAYQRPAPGAREVHVYVIDSGILPTHAEFRRQSGAGSRIGLGYNAYASTPAAHCLTHGTHVAGTVGGKTMGVAPFAMIHSVRVIDCSRSVTSEAVVAGVNWVMGQVMDKAKGHRKPSVANMSLEFDLRVKSLDTAIQNSIKAGIPYVVAAGNRNRNACAVSPAGVPDAITVASVDPENDSKAGISGGPCVDLFAPGVAIASASSAHNYAWDYQDGTSSAAPHVTGVAALVLSRQAAGPSAATPGAVWNAILAAANVSGTPGWCGVVNRGASYNRLLHWGAGTPADGLKDAEVPKGKPRACSGK